MKDRLVAMTLPFAAGLALVAVAAFVAELPTTASVLLGLAVAIGLLGIQLRFDELDRTMHSQLSALADSLAAQTDLVRHQTTRVRRDLKDARDELAAVPADTAYLHRLIGGVAPGSATLPSLNRSSAGSQTLLALSSALQGRRAATVVEVGAGGSTVLAALALRAAGSGHVYALESDTDVREATRSQLADHGASSYGTVVDAPLSRVELAGGAETVWYDLAKLPDTPIDVLVLGAGVPERSLALSMLGDRLADGAVIVVDSSVSADDRAAIEGWDGLEFLGRRFAVVDRDDRTLQVRATLLEQAAPARKRATKAAPKATTTRTRKPAAKRTTAKRTAKKAVEAPAVEAPAVEAAVEAEAPVVESAAVESAQTEVQADVVEAQADVVEAREQVIDGVPDFAADEHIDDTGDRLAEAAEGVVDDVEEQATA